MELRILGSLEVLEDGRHIGVGGPRPRSLLAILALRRGEVVPAEELVERLYGGRPPAGAAKSLQAHISRLRKALGAGTTLRTTGRGYVLDLEPGSLDLDRFEELVRRGRAALAGHDAAAASSALGEALALWRGPPLADFRYEEFAQSEIARLEERRLAAVEDRIEADLELGHAGDVVPELESLVREYPLRERIRRQLMLALYRSGRQAEALEAYQDARRALTEELGIEPGRALRDLQQAILEQRPALELEPADEPVSPPNVVPAPKRSEGAEARDMRLERKTVTVAHVRVAVTSASGEEVDPEVLRHVLGRVSEHVTAVVESHEGSIDAITGDSIGAVFGLPSVHEDDASRALRAADEIRDRLDVLAVELERESTGRLELRIGLSTGAVMTGGAASQPRATGAPLTTAARLAQDAELGTIVADDATRRAAGTRRDARRFVSPMVGRTRERRRMQDAFDQAVADTSCQLFTIIGAAGVGKSRLVQEFFVDVAERALVASGRCLPYGEGITFWPLLEAIKSLPGFDEGSDPDKVSASLAELIEGTEGSALMAQRVCEVIGLSEGPTGTEEGFEAVRAFLEALATRQPLVVVFDDVHWGESTFLDFVEHLADWSRGAPILLLCMARPELLDVRPSWGGGKLNATSVLLEPLSDDECTELVANLIGETELAGEVETRIANAAEGNPLFVEEMLSMLIDEGILVRENGRWVAAGDLGGFPVPPTIHALLAARLDQLTADERAAIEPAAVEGKVFHESSVARLAPDVAVPAALGALVRKELIRPERPVFAGERAYRFRHLMIRDAAYDAIPKGARAGLHERHVEWLEKKTGERAVEFDEIVGYHLEQAARYRTELGQVDERSRALSRHAAERLGSAGRRAFLRSDGPAGVNLISRAVALVPADDALRVELVPNVRAIQGISDLTWAERVLTEAVETAATTGDRGLAAHALVQRGFLRLFTGEDVPAQELIELANRAIGVFEELGDQLALARAWRLVAQAHYLGRSGAACADASEHALTHAQLARDGFELREIVEWLVIALLLGPAHGSDAIQRCERLLQETAGDPLLEAQILGALAPLFAMQGRAAEADDALARGGRVMADLGESIWIVSFWRAMVYLWRNDAVAAEHELRPSYDALKRIGERSHFTSLAHGLADTLYMQGRYDEAEQLTRECEAACRPNDVHSHVFWRSIRAKVLARRGDLDEALVLAHEAVGIAEGSDFLPARAGAMEDLSKVLHMAGRMKEARTALDAAIERFERKGNAVAADRVRRLLTGVTDSTSLDGASV